MGVFNNYRVLPLFFVILFLAACENKKTVCVPENQTPKAPIHMAELLEMTPVVSEHNARTSIEIGGKLVEVDKLVNYPICNDKWSGIVYVNCDAQVADDSKIESENPLFFKGCDLQIDSNTIVYVAAHNDSAYYKGCSCHTGEDPQN